MFLISATSPLTPTSALKRCRHISWESKLFMGRGGIPLFSQEMHKSYRLHLSGTSLSDGQEVKCFWWRVEVRWTDGQCGVVPFGRARSVWCGDLAAMGTGSLFFHLPPPDNKNILDTERRGSFLSALTGWERPQCSATGGRDTHRQTHTGTHKTVRLK